MDKLTLTVLAAQHPAACVTDSDGDQWHAACFAQFSNTMSARYVDGAFVSDPDGSGCYMGDEGRDTCPLVPRPMTSAPEGVWTP